ncbi:hypothetical protein [Clostridium neonatale]
MLNKYRNSACHGYKQHFVEDIKIFYSNKKESIKNILDYLDKIISDR